MNRRRHTLSLDDQKAVDVLLDHAANLHGLRMTRHTAPVAPGRLTAASRLLGLLGELPLIEPPKDLVARTMRRIDQRAAVAIPRRLTHSNPRSSMHAH